MGLGSFCVGGARSGDKVRDFQDRFNRTFETRFRFDPKDSVLVAKTLAYSSSRLQLAHFRGSSCVLYSLPREHLYVGEKRFLVTLQTQGTSAIRQSGGQAIAIPGSLFVVDVSKPLQLDRTHPASTPGSVVVCRGA